MTMHENEPVFLLKTSDGEQQLPVDGELLMGRDPSSDVVLDKGLASRHHAKLRPDSEGVWVEDLGSTNGTFVNEEQITEPRLLRVGDELRCGESRFWLAEKESAEKESQVAVDADATLLHTYDSAAEAKVTAAAGKPLIETRPSAPPPVTPRASTAKLKETQAASAPKEKPKANTPDSKAPPSWVLNNQQSVDGTAFISKDMLKDSLLNSGSKALSQEAVMEPTLVGNSNPVMGQRFQLIGDNKVKWEVGRSINADIMLNDDSVSGAHAQILYEKGRWKLVDLMSANGTYANGKKCLTGYLASGDLIRFGGVECAFMLPMTEEVTDSDSDAPEEPRSSGLREIVASLDRAAIKMAAIAFGVTAALAGLVVIIIAQFS